MCVSVCGHCSESSEQPCQGVAGQEFMQPNQNKLNRQGQKKSPEILHFSRRTDLLETWTKTLPSYTSHTHKPRLGPVKEVVQSLFFSIKS